MNNILKISVLVCSLFLASCSSDENDSTLHISESILSGVVNGEKFTAKGGKSFRSGDDVSINITNVSADCASKVDEYDVSISTFVPFEIGINTDVNVAFHKKGQTPMNYFKATVTVVETTDTTITVKIKANSSSENSVEGKFTVNYCG